MENRIDRFNLGLLGSPFALSKDGDTYVIPAGDTFEVRHVNSLNEMCLATPAMVGSKLFNRTLEHLYCIEEVRP